MASIRRTSTQPKTNLKSYQLARRKVERELRAVMDTVDQAHDGVLTFEMFGRFLHSIGIYKILFSPTYKITCKLDGELIGGGYANGLKGVNISQTWNERRDKELEFQVNLWRMLKRPQSDCVDTVLLLELVSLLCDSASESVEELVTYTEGTTQL